MFLRQAMSSLLSAALPAFHVKAPLNLSNHAFAIREAAWTSKPVG